MAMPQRDDWIEEIKRLDALLEYAVMHGDEAEAEPPSPRLRRSSRLRGVEETHGGVLNLAKQVSNCFAEKLN